MVVCPENFFDSQNGTLTENLFGDGGGVAEKNFRKGPASQNMPKGPVFLRYATAHTVGKFSRQID
jgi:hypothetical protein